MERLEQILRLKRPSRGCTEAEAINKFIKPTGAIADNYGNYHLKIEDAPVIWSCHTDTVHFKSGHQEIQYGDDNLIYLDEKVKKADCLGADDGAGIWLMMNMIEAKVPGYYIFHRDEEIGGGGSTFIAGDGDWQKVLAHIKMCIALDRRGYNDVINFQGCRTASNAFAQALASQLHNRMYPNGLKDEPENLRNWQWAPSPNGSFTDSANYTDIVGECTNLSVGYFSQHSHLECLNPKFLKKLLKALKDLNIEGLVNHCERQPGDVEYKMTSRNPYRGYGQVSRKKPERTKNWGGEIFTSSIDVSGRDSVLDVTGTDEDFSDKYCDMTEVVENYPDEVAQLLETMGYDSSRLIDDIDSLTGCINV